MSPKERAITPTTRTLEYLADLGYLAGEVERRLTNRLVMDLFGIFDIVAVKPGNPTRGIQVTTGPHHADRYKKLKAHENTRLCSDSGWSCEVWSWRFAAGGRWTLRIQTLGPETWK